jgi:MoaA/NifB/PqqE/SkfB family radical SAM enzyme
MQGQGVFMTDGRAEDIQITKICLLVTNKCNLWCKMCDYRMVRLGRPELTLAEIRNIIGTVGEQGLQHLELSGGEPMMRPDIYEIIGTAHALRIKVSMITNGTLIGEPEASRLVQAGLNDLIVSLEGFAEVNDRLRGRGNYNKGMETIGYFQKNRDFTGRIQVAITISRQNYGQLFEFTRYLLESIGIDAISFHPFNRNMLHRKKHDHPDDLMIPGAEIPGLEQELMNIVEYAQNHRDVFQDTAILSRIPDYFAGKLKAPATGCNKPLTSCGVDACGLVYPCPVMNESVGNSSQISFREIITAPKYRRICMKALRSQCQGCVSGGVA